MDQVFIRDLKARGILGVYEWERHEAQEIIINVTLYTDLSQAAASDDIRQCVDYHQLATKLLTHSETAQRLTVEALAEDLARLCLATPGVLKVRLRVEKPAALRFARSAGVEIERSRS
jgi:FolB domain-containing protein